MMCFSFITVQLLYMLFQLSQSITIMWDFIFHLWEEERDIETIKKDRENQDRLLIVVGNQV